MSEERRPDGGDLPFTDLPAVMVEELLERSKDVAQHLIEPLGKVPDRRTKYRKDLESYGLRTDKEFFGADTQVPTACASDGSYAVERLMATDLVVAGAVVMEGLTPPQETRIWEQPRHICHIDHEQHSEGTNTILRSIMMGEELVLLRDAPHGLALFDGTLSLPLIYFNQAWNSANDDDVGLKCAKKFLTKFPEYIRAYIDVLEAASGDKQYAGLPKYSTRSEIGSKMEWQEGLDDRFFMTSLLDERELINPVPFGMPKERNNWHLGPKSRPIEGGAEVVAALGKVHVFYYKPHKWLPALRIEIPGAVADSKDRLGAVIRGLMHQMDAPAMLEPYPIFLADRTAKALSRSLPAIRQVITQQISENYEGDISEVFMSLNSYRSETGR